MTRWDPSNASLDSTYDFSFGDARQAQWLRNGTILFVNDTNNSNIVKCEAPTPWEVSGLSEVQSFSTSNEGTPEKCLHVHPSESTMLVGVDPDQNDNTANKYVEYFIGNDLDLSSAGYIQDPSISINGFTGPVQWRPDGSEFFYIDYSQASALRKGSDVDRAFRYSHNQNDKIYSGFDSTRNGFYVKSDGKKIYTLSWEGAITYYTTGTAWDFTSLTSEVSFNLTTDTSMPDVNMSGLTWKPDGSHFYVSGRDGVIYQFSVPTDNKLYSVWETSGHERNVSHDEIFQTEHKQLAYDHENFSEINPDPASCWPLQERTTSSDAEDVAGDNNLVIDSAYSPDQPAPYSRTAIRAANDRSYSIEGSVSGLDILSGFTICMWVKYNPVTRDRFVSVGDGSTEVVKCNSTYQSDQLQMTLEDDDGNEYEIESGVSISSGNWYFLVYQFDNSTDEIKLFAWDINGNLEQSDSLSGVSPYTSGIDTISIGSKLGDGSFNYSSDSEFFEVRWYNQPLTQTQLEDLGSIIWGPKFTQDKQKHTRLTTGPDHARTQKNHDDRSGQILTPKSFWPLYESEGTKANDIIGRNDGSLSSDVAIGRDGIRGGNAIYCPTTASGHPFQVIDPVDELGNALESNPIHFNFWYYRTEVSNGVILRIKLESTDDGSGSIDVRDITDGFEFYGGKDGNSIQVTSTDITNDDWYFISVIFKPGSSNTIATLDVFDSSGSQIDFTDGDSTVINGNLTNGIISEVNSDFHGGKICNIRLYNQEIENTSEGNLAEEAGGPNYWSGRPVQL